MPFDNSLFEYDAGYYEFLPGRWLPGKHVPKAMYTWSQKAVEAATSVCMEERDILSATYPKTGQTWTMAIMGLILQAKEIEAGKDICTSDIYLQMPFMETESTSGQLGADTLERLPHPRLLKSHLPFPMYENQLKRYPDMKIMLTMRNPKDTLVSFYHHIRSTNQLGRFTGNWDQYFEYLVKGKKLPWGDFFEHNAEWYKFHKDRENSLVIKYEDLKKNYRDHVIQIAQFMGYTLSEKVVDHVVRKTTKEVMGPDLNNLFCKFSFWDPEKNFIRKGVVGDWVNYFTPEQNQYVEEKCQEYFEPLGLEFEYYPQ